MTFESSGWCFPSFPCSPWSPCYPCSPNLLHVLPSGMGARGVSSENVENRWLKSHWKASEGEKQAYIRWCLNKDIHCMFVEGKSRTVFFLQTLLFTAFLATVQKIITYALVSTWSLVTSGWEHVKRIMHHWLYHITLISLLIASIYMKGVVHGQRWRHSFAHGLPGQQV